MVVFFPCQVVISLHPLQKRSNSRNQRKMMRQQAALKWPGGVFFLDDMDLKASGNMKIEEFQGGK